MHSPSFPSLPPHPRNPSRRYKNHLLNLIKDQFKNVNLADLKASSDV
jgi:hypothetical protein